MTTKVRSACDRCHSNKVRCSGDVPCQSCLVSKSLCFYSLSNPLGRPRGTKNGINRTRPSSNNLGRRNMTLEGEGITTASEQGASRRRSLLCSEDKPDAPDVDVSDNQQSDVPEVPRPGSQTPIDEAWFTSAVDGQDIFDLPDFASPSSLGRNSSNLAHPSLQTLADAPPYNPRDQERQSDTPMLGLASLDQPDAWNTVRTPADQAWTGPASLYLRNASTVCRSYLQPSVLSNRCRWL